MLRSLLFLITLAITTTAQPYPGQIATPGLAILDSPQPYTPFQVNTTMPIAIDVSRDGKLLPGESIDYLTIYLISNPNVNISVATPLDLSSEPGSTVKHINWNIPACVAAGSYNLTIYEIDTANGSTTAFLYAVPVVINVPSGWTVQSPCPVNYSVPVAAASPAASVQPSSGSQSSSGAMTVTINLAVATMMAVVAVMAAMTI